MASERDEELAWTETAVADASAPVMESAGATLGRYRLERELGAGAMGVVHAAFDPDLERRVALKVLKNASASLEARDRLLREARAMARLTHANVVTVHEVGTVAGRDYVAMELIHGEPLAEWLRETRRPAAAILEAFLAAGRGLAAAHAAGIVHRDFKPHNVLRGRDGRIVVTDFGLARQVDGDRPPALDATLPAGPASGAASLSGTPSSLAGLTMAGSLLGTPAYMAPEQWTGGQVTPATDQFAYCVALWEALAGERPYRGPTFDDLRAQVARGPAALDAARIPRRVRGLLRRGLAPDPAQRWPSMDALFARLARARRRPGVAIAIAGGAVVAAGAAVVALRPSAPAAACDPPARDLASVWSPAIAAALRAATSDAHAAVIDAGAHDWQAARTTACAAPPQVRPAQLACLDGALARLDALRRAAERVPAAAAEELQAQMVDPTICNKPAALEVPRLTVAPAPEVIDAYALLARSATDARPSERETLALAEAATAPPCARVIATLAFDAASQDEARARTRTSAAVGIADQCGDERLRADLLIRLVPYQRERHDGGRGGDAALQQAKAAANRVMQPDLAAAIASLERLAAWQRDQWDEALRLFDAELAGYGARHLVVRQLRAAVDRLGLRRGRGDPADLEAIAADVRTWRPIAVATHQADLTWRLDFHAAHARFKLGDVTGAHAELLRLWQTRPASRRPASEHTIEGEVVDAHGRPVPHATVAAAKNLTTDAAGIDYYHHDDSLQITTTDAGGRFVLHDVAAFGAVAAQLGDRRSLPARIAARVKLILAPTRTVTGRVKLDGTPHTHPLIIADIADVPSPLYYLMAPIAPDGSFSLSGVPLGPIHLGVLVSEHGSEDERIEFRDVPASTGPVTDLELTPPSSAGTIDVVVRSTVATPVSGAEVFVLSGKPQIKNLADLLQVHPMGTQQALARSVPEGDLPAPLAQTIRRGDLLAHVEHAGRGLLTVCAYSFASDVMDPAMEDRALAHLAQIAVTCKPIAPDASVVVVSVSPPPRFD